MLIDLPYAIVIAVAEYHIHRARQYLEKDYKWDKEKDIRNVEVIAAESDWYLTGASVGAFGFYKDKVNCMIHEGTFPKAEVIGSVEVISATEVKL